MNLQSILNEKYGRSVKDCTNEEIYYGLLDMVKAAAREKTAPGGKKKVYYMFFH